MSNATEQESDIILFEGQKCLLETHWMFPSPLETYYRTDPSRKSPFRAAGTSNYRGHVATWEIADERLYLVGIESRGASEPDSTESKVPQPASQTLLRELFPKVIDKNGRVFADWYDGNLRVFGKPAKQSYKHSGDEESHEFVAYTEITLIQFKGGMVTKKKSFPQDEYWKKFQTYLEYRKLEADEVAAISDHVKFLDVHGGRWEDIGSIEPEGPARTEKDFDAFLTRYWTAPIRIPLTKFEIVRDATIDFADTGWTIDSGLRIAKGGHLLMLEMGSSNVPKGPWSPYTPGAVQVLVQLGSADPKEITFTEKDAGIVKVINNFGNADNPRKHVTGKLKLDRNEKGEILLNGSVRLTSENPTTNQEILFESRTITVLGLEEYVKRQIPQGAEVNEADRILKEIHENSKK